MKAAHDLDVKRLQGVTGGLDEEDAGMDAVIYDVHAVDLILRIEISIVTLLDVVDNRSPRFVVVDEVSEAGSVNDGQAKADASLLDVGADRLDRDRLGYYVKARPLAVPRGIQRGVEKSVDERGFTETGFT